MNTLVIILSTVAMGALALDTAEFASCTERFKTAVGCMLDKADAAAEGFDEVAMKTCVQNQMAECMKANPELAAKAKAMMGSVPARRAAKKECMMEIAPALAGRMETCVQAKYPGIELPDFDKLTERKGMKMLFAMKVCKYAMKACPAIAKCLPIDPKELKAGICATKKECFGDLKESCAEVCQEMHTTACECMKKPTFSQFAKQEMQTCMAKAAPDAQAKGFRSVLAKLEKVREQAEAKRDMHHKFYKKFCSEKAKFDEDDMCKEEEDEE